MEAHRIIEIVFTNVARLYETKWQAILKKDGNKECRQPRTCKTMIAYILSMRFSKEEIAYLLRMSESSITIYLQDAARNYGYGGTFFENANTIKKLIN